MMNWTNYTKKMSNPCKKTLYFYTLHPVSILESCRNGAKFNYPAAKLHVECIIAHSTIYTYNILSLVSPPMGHVLFLFQWNDPSETSWVFLFICICLYIIVQPFMMSRLHVISGLFNILCQWKYEPYVDKTMPIMTNKDRTICLCFFLSK